MSKVVPVSGVLFIEQLNKAKRTEKGSPFVNTVVSSNLGTVKYSSTEEFPAGTQIYFAGNYERLIVEGVEIIAVKTEHVLAKVMD